MKAKKNGHKHAVAVEDKPEKTPAQGLWSGTISFSLVAIPVRLGKAVSGVEIFLQVG